MRCRGPALGGLPRCARYVPLSETLVGWQSCCYCTQSAECSGATCHGSREPTCQGKKLKCSEAENRPGDCRKTHSGAVLSQSVTVPVQSMTVCYNPFTVLLQSCTALCPWSSSHPSSTPPATCPHYFSSSFLRGRGARYPAPSLATATPKPQNLTETTPSVALTRGVKS